MRTQWDDIEILRAIDALQEQLGGGPVSANGRDVMNGIAGSWVTDPALISGFAYELDLARAAGLLTFEVADHAAAYRSQNTDFYLQNVRNLALTIAPGSEGGCTETEKAQTIPEGIRDLAVQPTLRHYRLTTDR